MRSGGCAEKAMNVESFAAAALDFPGWREPRPSAKSAGGPEVPDESLACESGYLSLKGTDPEEGDASGMADPVSCSTVGCDYTEMRMKVDFFRKLGYSTQEVLVVLQKHGPHADTNTVLGELVTHGMVAGDRNPAAAPLEAPEMPLVPRGGSASNSPAHAAPSEGREGENLRPVVIDGSNVAMSHGDKDVFSCRGILLAVNWFLDRGHTDVTVFVPSWRKEQPRPDVPITDQHILRELEKKKILVFTPSRRVGGKRLVCYDDRFIVKLAYESDGIVVSNDVYRDLQTEKPEWKKFVEERLLMYSFVNDKFMPPDDPLGRHGPSLDNFLRKKPVVPEHKKQQCPYGKKCTYGIKCKYYHPERLHQLQRSVADELRANAKLSPTRSTAAAKEERRSRRPPPAEFPGSATTEGEKMPSQKAVVEKKSSLQKAMHCDMLPPHKGGVHLSSALAKKNGGSDSYRPPERGQPPPVAPRTDSLPYTSQECLDSGIGSLESQLSEMWPSHGTPSHQELLAWSSPSRGQRQVPQQPPGLKSGGYSQHQPLPASDPQQLYSPDPSSVRLAACSFPGFGPPADTPAGTGQKFWSEPYRPLATAGRDLPGAHQLAYDDASRPWAAPDRFAEERANVHIRLCGIFHPRLVGAVMSRFPQVLDPQQLAAEILTYKSQNPGI